VKAKAGVSGLGSPRGEPISSFTLGHLDANSIAADLGLQLDRLSPGIGFGAQRLDDKLMDQ